MMKESGNGEQGEDNEMAQNKDYGKHVRHATKVVGHAAYSERQLGR